MKVLAAPFLAELFLCAVVVVGFLAEWSLVITLLVLLCLEACEVDKVLSSSKICVERVEARDWKKWIRIAISLYRLSGGICQHHEHYFMRRSRLKLVSKLKTHGRGVIVPWLYCPHSHLIIFLQLPPEALLLDILVILKTL